MLHFQINPQSHVPAYRQLMDQVKFYVASGAMKPGDQLPSIRELAAAFPVSQRCRRWVQLAGSFPPSITQLSPEEYEHFIERREWTQYVSAIESTDTSRLPSYGDYATQPARYEVSPPFRASPTVRYTLAERFVVLRGRLNLPDAAQQYVGHARYLEGFAEFAEIVRTPGDEYVARIATGLHRTGNGTTWRVASLSRHVHVACVQSAAFEEVHAQVSPLGGANHPAPW